MTNDAYAYDCPNCSANLEFDTLTQNFTCRYCGSAFSAEQLEEIYPTEINTAETLEEKTITEEQQRETERFSEENNLYSCPNCGASIITDNRDSASAYCHYCNSAVILTGRLSGEYKPDKIIPFKKTKQDAINGFMQWCGKKFFVPNDFKSQKTLEEIRGIYVPYWLADCCVEGELIANAKKTSTSRLGDYITTTIKEYHIVRKGSIIYRKVPADGSSRANDLLMENIEPFDYNELEDFKMSYLSGHNAEKYDIDKDSIFPRILERTRISAEKSFKNTIKGYSIITSKTSKFDITHINWDYAMLPMWFLSYKYKNKYYHFAMNGQTGKFAGELPVSKLKIFLTGAAIALGILLFFFGIPILALIGGLFL